ncbi:MAG: glycoside hydrolase N-terminal domain-containing protein [Lentisphaerae bacterium]|nr:glycoside hydrolase N-terminal domain-containing protein [Lentisphaerota bacterium]
MNHKEIISKHDLIFETAPDIWQNGSPIGNGHFGAMVYQPENSIEFAVAKLDVWDRRAEMPPQIPFSKIREIIKDNPEKLTPALQVEFPSENSIMPGPKPCGKLNISADKSFIDLTVFSREQKLDLGKAVCSGTYEVSSKQMGFESFVDPSHNLLAVKMEDLWTDRKLNCSYVQEVVLAREIDYQLGLPVLSYDNGISYVRYSFPDGFEYVMAMLVDSAECASPEIYPEYVKIKVKLDYSKKRKNSYCVYLAVATSMDSADPFRSVTGILNDAKAEGFSSIKKRHLAWWSEFWEKSAVEFGNKFLEGIWYFSLYQFASSSRGDIAPGLFGLWNASKTPPWSGDYHGDINMAMTYWPIFSTNHIELGDPFFKTFKKLVAPAIRQTSELYQIDGLKFPIATLDTCVELCPGYYRMMQCTTAFYGLIFWNWYLYTKDKVILKEQIFQILEEGAKFYLALTEEKNGSVLIGPSWAPEQGPCPAYNTNNDLGLIKPFWQAYVKACEILGLSTKYKLKVEYYLGKFPKYPEKNG